MNIIASEIGNIFKNIKPPLGILALIPPFLIVIVAIWSIFWKGLALWRSSQNKQKYWFIALLIVNTVGLLEIIYLAFFQRQKTLLKKISSKSYKNL